MQVEGQLTITRPADTVRAALNDPAVLQAILPSCTGVRQTGPGQFKATVTRKIGPLSLSVEPEIELVAQPDGRAALSFRAGNRIAGTVTSELMLRMDQTGQHTQLSWVGAVTASGLAQRMLAERAGRLAPLVLGLFNELKHKVEKTV